MTKTGTKSSETKWTINIRNGGLLEHVCCHGVGHPDPAFVKKLDELGNKGWSTHGCDGCCGHDDFPGRIRDEV